MERKYSLKEIDRMRSAIELSYPTGVSFRGGERSAEVEDRLRTYMQNGTTPEELEKMRDERMDADRQRHEAERRYRQELAEANPAPSPPETAREVIERWFDECVAKYDGAAAESKELFDGSMGMTLLRYANKHAPDGCNITIRDMERFLDEKGVRSRRLGWLGSKTYDGIRHIIYGNVRRGNYGT